MSGTQRVVRGGSWIDYPRLVGFSHRYGFVPDEWDLDRGFRCVVAP
jgi:formylglycine-generating enzyme required for sulfatase activity